MEVEGAPKAAPWGEGERPPWLAPDDQQPSKREWSPARDRMEAELELRARLEEQRRLRRRSLLRIFFLPFIWAASLLQAVVVVGRRADDAEEAPPRHGSGGGVATLDTMPAGRPLVAPRPVSEREPEPAGEPRPVAEAETVGAPETAADTLAEPQDEAGPAPPEHLEVDWPSKVASAHPVTPAAPPPIARPVVPDWDWRPSAAPPKPAPAVERPAAVVARAPEPLPAAEAIAVILGACVRASAAEVGVIALLQDDRLVVRAWSGITQELAARLALDVMGELCLDVIVGGEAFLGTAPPPSDHDPFHPVSILCVPIPLGAAEAGVVLLAGYAAGHAFSEHHRRLVASLADQAGHSLVRAGAYQMAIEPGDSWRSLSDIGASAAVAEPPPAPPPAEVASPAPGAPEKQAAAPSGQAAVPAAEVSATQMIDPEMVARIVAAARARTRALQLEQDPMATMTLDPATLARVISQANAAREAAEKEAEGARAKIAAEVAQEEERRAEEQRRAAEQRRAEDQRRAEEERRLAEQLRLEEQRRAEEGQRAEEARRAEEERLIAAEAPPAELVAAPTEAIADVVPETAPMERPLLEPVLEPVPVERPAPAPRPTKDRVPWTARVRSQMSKIQERKEQDRQRYRDEILAAVRNLSWDGYHALVADIFRRKAFEVFPPPAEGSDLDVIDMVVDRDGQRRLVNCQLRGIEEVPLAAVSEMATVVYNYNVAGAYLISDGVYDTQAIEYGPTAGIVLVDSDALIDLVIETTLKDERKQSVGGRLAGVFKRGPK